MEVVTVILTTLHLGVNCSSAKGTLRYPLSEFEPPTFWSQGNHATYWAIPAPTTSSQQTPPKLKFSITCLLLEFLSSKIMNRIRDKALAESNTHQK